MEPTTRWLIVLQPNQRDLYELLRRSLKEDSPVSVIYDRRARERRRGSDSPRADRRRTDRRQRRPSGWFYETEVVQIIQTDDSRSPAPARTERSVGSRACPDCGTVVEFEMPRFPHPPARLEVDTIHSGSQHFVEIHAFTPTGRLLLSQRNQAWRRGG